MSVIVENISKAFGDVKVFENISFKVEPGEIVCIKGKSGEGKTTLLRCLNHLETVDEGRIIIDGLDLTNVKDSRLVGQKIGLVFQSYNLFPHLSVMENLALAPKYLKTGTDEEIINRGRELLKTLEILDKEDVYPYQLSGGQKQRVAIARACMLNPSVLCFDEPTSALDAETTKQISSVIRKLAATGMSILIVTHDEQFVDEIAERIIKMSNGKIEEIKK
ncbi:amino acid ABC transporter ATP-binding protein [Gudongella oleilytica]|jgi:ABC-type polar amino acid transport system ATPase subunit|uniref:amino acid ABC transporter ATP-binding protein n=1 Tax=Gudongella oleilytica TaxID=1582259 RepID=UPI000EE7F0B1|nr:amino acid ABC transporter ATP-binding protein [Gudongella oleilytica]MDY0256843.1 amino acid ABC transporter ATP-binding protein [Gudongella oleilytica]HCO19456.1 polar amino acid ABC transporter ATP-binding protein [Tissierellales bacterium]